MSETIAVPSDMLVELLEVGTSCMDARLLHSKWRETVEDALAEDKRLLQVAKTSEGAFRERTRQAALALGIPESELTQWIFHPNKAVFEKA